MNDHDASASSLNELPSKGPSVRIVAPGTGHFFIISGQHLITACRRLAEIRTKKHLDVPRCVSKSLLNGHFEDFPFLDDASPSYALQMCPKRVGSFTSQVDDGLRVYRREVPRTDQRSPRECF